MGLRAVARDAMKYVVMSYSGPTVRSFQEIAQELTQPPRTTSVEASPWKRRFMRHLPAGQSCRA